MGYMDYLSVDLFEQLDLLHGALMMGYPDYFGLGEWEPVRHLFEDKEDILFECI